MKGKCTFADEFQTLIKHCSSALVCVQKACLEKSKAPRARFTWICFLFMAVGVHLYFLVSVMCKC